MKSSFLLLQMIVMDPAKMSECLVYEILPTQIKPHFLFTFSDGAKNQYGLEEVPLGYIRGNVQPN